MTRKKVKLAWVENDKSRAISLKKRGVMLMKKVKELTILCDVTACLIMFYPFKVEPMVWPSVETACDLLNGFFALPGIEKKKKETSLESYLNEKTKKVHKKMMKTHKKNMVHAMDQLMVQLHRGRGLDDLNLSEIYALLSFSRDNIILCRKRLDCIQYRPLRNPLVPPFKAQFEELRTTTIDVCLGGGQEDGETSKTNEAAKRSSSHYLMDQSFFASPELPKPTTYQQTIMDMVSYNKNSNPRNYLLYQGSSSNGNPNLEMESIGAPVMTVHGLVGLVSESLQHHTMINNSINDMCQPRQCPFDFMSSEFKGKEEGSTTNNDDPQFHMRNNTIAINDGIRQESPPNGTTIGESNADV